VVPETKSIVIVGGGFAGTTLMRALDGKLPQGYELLLISEESYTTFNPMLPEALGASIFPEQVVAPIREMLTHARFVMGRVTTLDPARKTLVCSTLAGERTFHYEHLALAFGNRARLDLLPGLAEHALPLKTVGDAMHIRNTVLRRLARIELETDSSLRKRLGHFVVIGGGFSGVETAGELAACLDSIRRYYRRVAPNELKSRCCKICRGFCPSCRNNWGTPRTSHSRRAASTCASVPGRAASAKKACVSSTANT
jgi:NADH dehydrogenase